MLAAYYCFQCQKAIGLQLSRSHLHGENNGLQQSAVCSLHFVRTKLASLLPNIYWIVIFPPFKQVELCHLILIIYIQPELKVTLSFTHFIFTLDNGLKAIAKKSTTLHLTLGENHMSEKQTCANIFLGMGLPQCEALL